MKAKLTMSVLAALSLTVVATAGRPAGVPPQPTRPVVAPPTEHPPVVTVPPVQAPPVDIPSPPEAAAGQPPANHPPFSISDLQALLAAWGACDEGLSCEWDLNQDGVVGPKDLTKLVRHLERFRNHLLIAHRAATRSSRRVVIPPHPAFPAMPGLCPIHFRSQSFVDCS